LTQGSSGFFEKGLQKILSMVLSKDYKAISIAKADQCLGLGTEGGIT